MCSASDSRVVSCAAGTIIFFLIVNILGLTSGHHEEDGT